MEKHEYELIYYIFCLWVPNREYFTAKIKHVLDEIEPPLFLTFVVEYRSLFLLYSIFVLLTHCKFSIFFLHLNFCLQKKKNLAIFQRLNLSRILVALMEFWKLKKNSFNMYTKYGLLAWFNWVSFLSKYYCRVFNFISELLFHFCSFTYGYTPRRILWRSDECFFDLYSYNENHIEQNWVLSKSKK